MIWRRLTIRSARGFGRRLARDKKGVSVLEFGLMVIPFTLVMVGLLDLSYQMYVQSVFQGAANDAARIVTVESPNLGTSGSLENRIKETIQARMAPIDMTDAVYTVTADSYNRFSDAGQPERLTNDVNNNGRYDAGDCWLDSKPNNTWDANAARTGIGGADDVVKFTINLKMARLVPIGGLWGDGNTYDMNVTTAIKRQPFREQTQPVERC
jgi:Flp pilus assembly protein TadG